LVRARGVVRLYKTEERMDWTENLKGRVTFRFSNDAQAS